MQLISESALLGAVLVMLVLILFLRPIVAFWVTIGIITAFAGGIMLMPLFGVSWNVLSTFAVLLVIGVIVDDAIVVGENIHREVEIRATRRSGCGHCRHAAGLQACCIRRYHHDYRVCPMGNADRANTRLYAADYLCCDRVSRVLDHRMYVHSARTPLAHMKREDKTKQGRLARVQQRIADSLIWFAQNLYKPVLEFALKMRYATIVFFFIYFRVRDHAGGQPRGAVQIHAGD